MPNAARGQSADRVGRRARWATEPMAMTAYASVPTRQASMASHRFSPSVIVRAPSANASRFTLVPTPQKVDLAQCHIAFGIRNMIEAADLNTEGFIAVRNNGLCLRHVVHPVGWLDQASSPCAQRAEQGAPQHRVHSARIAGSAAPRRSCHTRVSCMAVTMPSTAIRLSPAGQAARGSTGPRSKRSHHRPPPRVAPRGDPGAWDQDKPFSQIRATVIEDTGIDSPSSNQNFRE